MYIYNAWEGWEGDTGRMLLLLLEIFRCNESSVQPGDSSHQRLHCILGYKTVLVGCHFISIAERKEVRRVRVNRSCRRILNTETNKAGI